MVILTKKAIIIIVLDTNYLLVRKKNSIINHRHLRLYQDSNAPLTELVTLASQC